MSKSKNTWRCALHGLRWTVASLIAATGICVTAWQLLDFAPRDAKADRAKMDVKSLETVVTAYMTNHGNFPKSLDELLKKDPTDGSPAPVTERFLKDPWGNRYHYDPTKLHPSNGKPLIWTDGPPDKNQRITNWE